MYNTLHNYSTLYKTLYTTLETYSKRFYIYIYIKAFTEFYTALQKIAKLYKKKTIHTCTQLYITLRAFTKLVKTVHSFYTTSHNTKYI